MPVNVNHNANKQILKIENRLITPERIREIQVEYESHEDEKRVSGAILTLDDGELVYLNQRKYWKLYGVLMQIGIEI